MAAVRFWDNNMTDVTSCENAVYNMALLSLISPGTIVIPPEKLKQWLCNFFFLKGAGGLGE